MRLATLPLLVLLATVPWAHASPISGDWTYVIENDGATIERSTATGDVTIPSELGGYPVKKVGAAGSIFGNPNTSVTSVVIPNGVTSIGNQAFYGCAAMTSVTIGNSVKSIGDSAFYGCTGMTAVVVGNSVTSIGVEAFSRCTGLTSVNIPDGVTSIGAYAFIGCYGLTSVSIGSGVRSIGESAFYGCTGLTSVSIGESLLLTVGNYAFGECPLVGTITLPLLATVGVAAFPNGVTITSSSASLADSLVEAIAQRVIAALPDNYGIATKEDLGIVLSNTIAQVQAAPNEYNLFSTAQFNANRTDGQTDVTTDPVSFNLFTQSQFDSNRITGQTDVTASPAAFNLFTQNQVAESFTQGENSVLQSIPSVDFSVPESTPLRVTLSGQNVIGVVVDDTESPLPDNWRLDEQAGQLIGSVVGSNSVRVVLEGEMAGGAPAIRIPMNFYPQAGQTIAPFARIPTQAFRFAPLTVTPPAASSGFAVVLSVKSGPATIVDNQVTFTGIGKVVLAANQVGNKDMKAAPEVTTSFLVTKGRQNMNFPPLNSIPFVQGNTFQLSATTTSALPIAYASSNQRVISISGSTATIVGRGVATIRATQSGDSNWAPATPINRAIRIY
jgi:hypothetical protein